MKHLFAPWRESWVMSAASDQGCGTSAGPSCLFCNCWGESDRDPDNLIVHRGSGCMVMLNRYPYNGGHLMVVPRDHVDALPLVSSKQRQELMQLTTSAVAIAQQMWNPDGFNVGINQGRASGAGIPDHVHLHVVPRWYGDTNFMTTIGDSRVVSIDLSRAQSSMAEAFALHYTR